MVASVCTSEAKSFSGESMSLGDEEAWLKWQFTAVLIKCFLRDLTVSCYLLFLSEIAVKLVLYSGKCMERVIKPTVTSQMRNKC